MKKQRSADTCVCAYRLSLVDAPQ